MTMALLRRRPLDDCITSGINSLPNIKGLSFSNSRYKAIVPSTNMSEQHMNQFNANTATGGHVPAIVITSSPDREAHFETSTSADTSMLAPSTVPNTVLDETKMLFKNSAQKASKSMDSTTTCRNPMTELEKAFAAMTLAVSISAFGAVRLLNNSGKPEMNV